jgi:hypothetical protein
MTIAVLFVLVCLGLSSGIWYWHFRKTSSRIAENLRSSISLISVYRLRLSNDILMGELYISKEKIYFEKASTTIFEFAPEDIETVIYNKRSVQFVLRNGQSYILRYMHPGAEKEGALGYWAFYSAAYHDPEALETFIDDLHSLNIEVVEGPTGKGSIYFYLSFACLVFAISLMIIMATI